MATKQQRVFGLGEKVKVAKKSRVVDKDRVQEGLPPEERIPIDQDVTGVEGEVTGVPYESPEKGEVCVPIKLENEAVIAVPESRLERTSKTPRKERLETSEGEKDVAGPVPSRETFEFWKRFFKEQDKKKKG